MTDVPASVRSLEFSSVTKPRCSTSTGGASDSRRDESSGYHLSICLDSSSGAACTHCTRWPVAKLTVRSASRSLGLLVATSSVPRSSRTGNTPYRRAHRSTRRATAFGSTREKSARGSSVRQGDVMDRAYHRQRQVQHRSDAHSSEWLRATCPVAQRRCTPFTNEARALTSCGATGSDGSLY